MKRNSPVKIRGLVTPSGWDENGKILSISISTFDEQEYVVEKDEKGEGLLPFLHKEIEIFGLIRKEGCSKRIKIKRYRLKSKMDWV